MSKMLKIQEIREIIKLVDQSDIEEFVYEHEGSKIKMKKNSKFAPVQEASLQVMQQPAVAQPAQVVTVPETVQAPAQAAQDENNAEQAASNLLKITSPMVGTFYQSPSPESGPYVTVGANVQPSTVVCIVEAMKLFNEIEAEVDGEIVEVLAKDGQLVEYGQPLFLVKPR